MRRTTTPTLSTMTPVVIDKHELHSTWPVYAQPDSRHVVEDLLTMTVDRTHTCYGPGDRVSVTATFRNDGVTVAVLRAFEFMLKETVIFRAGPRVAGKKTAPQVKVSSIGEQKTPVNLTIYGGQMHRAELACVIPQTHTTATVNAARHIDIAYSINVRAVLGSGKPLLMDLPVTISNWPRYVDSIHFKSLRWIMPDITVYSGVCPLKLSGTCSVFFFLYDVHASHRRIGPSVGLSLLPGTSAMSVQRLNPPRANAPGLATGGNNQPYNAVPRPGAQPPQNLRPYSIAERVGAHTADSAARPMANSNSLSSTQGYSSAPAGIQRPGFDEFGASTGGPVQPATFAGYSRQPDNYGAVEAPRADIDTRRQRSANAVPTKRFTITNGDGEVDGPSTAAPPPRKFMTAAEEKRQLEMAARGAASSAKVPEYSASPPPPAPIPAATPQATVSVSEPRNDTRTPQRKPAWLSAEEEKAMLFNKARADAERMQTSMGNYLSSQVSMRCLFSAAYDNLIAVPFSVCTSCTGQGRSPILVATYAST